jgi:hypothetical protein
LTNLSSRSTRAPKTTTTAVVGRRCAPYTPSKEIQAKGKERRAHPCWTEVRSTYQPRYEGGAGLRPERSDSKHKQTNARLDGQAVNMRLTSLGLQHGTPPAPLPEGPLLRTSSAMAAACCITEVVLRAPQFRCVLHHARTCRKLLDVATPPMRGSSFDGSRPAGAFLLLLECSIVTALRGRCNRWRRPTRWIRSWRATGSIKSSVEVLRGECPRDPAVCGLLDLFDRLQFLDRNERPLFGKSRGLS